MIKKRVQLSAYCWILSILSTILICGVFLYAKRQPHHEIAVWILWATIVVLVAFTLFYMPLYIALDSDRLTIIRPLKSKSIPLPEIEEVKACNPTMGAKRILGSGGWFGWYGLFREDDLGKYFAYYGKASDCFLVTLKDGRKYMFGCQDSPEVLSVLTQKMKQR